ncbi:MAG: ABC transporter substrate-binding protein [Firmicutes bacterium]|nr:ABC transporter substrate-binding protein [Bacillota bacterium]
MDKIRIITVLCILALTAFALGGCTTFNNFKEAFIDDPADQSQIISIGVYEPMSGADKDGAKAELAGIELAHDVMPEAGGHEIKLLYADNSSDIDAAETAVNTLLAKNPTVVLGSYGAIYSLVAGEYILPAKVPAIAITNTNPLITRNNSYYFRVCYIEATQGRLLAQYLDSTGEEEVGIMLPEKDDAATAMTTAFADEFKTLTDNDDAIAYYEKYTTGETDFSDHLEGLKKSEVKSVLLPGEMIDAANIIKQASEMGLDVTFLGTTTWGSEEFLKAITTDADGQPIDTVDPQKLAFVQFFAVDGDDETAVISKARETFLEAYHNKYGPDAEPEEAVALGYDAYGIAIDAVLRAENGSQLPEGEAIRDQLLSKDYEFDGASGIIRFTKKGDPKKTAYISTWENGAIKAI